MEDYYEKYLAPSVEPAMTEEPSESTPEESGEITAADTAGETELLAYDTVTGDTESIMNDHSWGGIYICNDLRGTDAY